MTSVAHTTHATKDGSQRKRAAFRALALPGVVALSVLAAACGSSSGAKVAQVGSTNGANGAGASSGSRSDPVAYSACMRSHGVANFPDPDSDGKIHLSPAIDQRSRTYQAAHRACRALARSTEQTRTQLLPQLPSLLAYAKCMRTHGVPTFPDPDITPDGHHIEFPVTNFTNSPTFTAAAAACRGKLSPDQSSRLSGRLLGAGKQPAPHGGK
jgi:hypothetical protein